MLNTKPIHNEYVVNTKWMHNASMENKLCIAYEYTMTVPKIRNEDKWIHHEHIMETPWTHNESIILYSGHTLNTYEFKVETFWIHDEFNS